MAPTPSILRSLTRIGRLQNRWARAVRNTDQRRRASEFCGICDDLGKLRDPPPELVGSIIHDFLDTDGLSNEDLVLIEERIAALEQDSSCQLDFYSLWNTLLASRDERSELRQARAVLVRMCHSKHLSSAVQTECLRQLAQRDSQSDEHVELYLAFLSRTDEPAAEETILNLLERVCDVDVDSSKVRLKRAAEVAERLVALKIDVPGALRAGGLKLLVLDGIPDKAERWLIAALRKDRRDVKAGIALIGTWISCDKYENALKLYSKSQNHTIQALTLLASTLRWIDDPSVAGLPPTTARQLASTDLSKLVGDRWALAVGRLHLIEGDADRAAEALRIPAEQHPADIERLYHYAWSLALCGREDALRQCYESLEGRYERWVVALICRDLRADLVSDEELHDCLDAQIERNQTVIRARLALFKMLPTGFRWIPDDGSFAENLEGYRTLLAVGFRLRSSKVDTWIKTGWMLRLPRAEQLLWSGVRELLFGYRERARSLLKEAIQLGSRRANLILGVSLLERDYNSQEGTRALINGLGGRNDEKAQLLRAHVKSCEGNSNDANREFDELRAAGSARSTYALRNVYLHHFSSLNKSNDGRDARVYLEQAAGLPEHDPGPPHVCPDDRLIARAARYLFDPKRSGRELAECWQEFEQLSPIRQQPWLVWVAIVAQLSAGEADAVDSACRTIQEVAESTELLEPSIACLLARETVAAFARDDVTPNTDSLHQALNVLAELSGDEVVRHYRDLLGAKVASRQASAAHAVRLAQANQGNVPICFLAARAELRTGQQSALALLRQIQATDDFSIGLATCFVSLLEGRIPSPHECPSPPSAASASLVAATHWLNAIALLNDEQAGRCYDSILDALACRLGDTPILRLGRILPSLCKQVASSGTPPAPIVELVMEHAASAETVDDTVLAARCAGAIGETEIACQLWTKALELSDASDPAIAEEYKQLLCHIAVHDVAGRNPNVAASRLISAAALAPVESNGRSATSKLNTFARNLQLEAATLRVLQRVLTVPEGVPEPTSRFSFLARALEKEESLLTSVQRDAVVDQHVTKLLKSRQSDVECLHGLAVFFREQAISARNSGVETAANLWRTSMALWTLLLSSNAFWREFSRDRLTQHGTDERTSLADEQSAHLRTAAIRDLLTFHVSDGQRAFGTGDMTAARNHFQNLVMCQDHSALRSVLKERNIVIALKSDDRVLAETAEIAAELVDDFSLQILRDAKKAADDPDAIGILPEGIRRNYEGALGQLDRFHALDVPSARACRASLEYYNDWCYDLYVTQRFDEIRELMIPARALADRLASRCTHGLGHTPENQALSTHFLLRGFTHGDSEGAVGEYEEALRWNPANDNAQQLLGQAADRVLTEQLNSAVESASNGRFDQAYQVIDGVADHLQGDEANESVTRCRALVLVRHAESLASDGYFGQALVRAQQASCLEPDEPQISAFVKEMRELAPEEDAIRHFKTAQENMVQEDFEAAITSANSVPENSRYSDQAKQLQSAAHFRSGSEAASTKRFTDAVRHLRDALSLNDDAEESRIIGDQLQRVLFQQGIDAANNQRFDKATSCLEAALKQNPKSEHAPHIREQLEAIVDAKFQHTVYQATEKGRWDDAAKLVRNAIAGRKTKKQRNELNSQLSQILNAHAVKLLNSDQERMKPFHDALSEIMATAQSLQSSYRPSYTSSQSPPADCAVCSGSSSFSKSPSLFPPSDPFALSSLSPSFSSNLNTARMWVAMRVLDKAAVSGSFAVDGLASFWRQFDDALCPSCRSAMKTAGNTARAKTLLKEAVSVDPGNTVAQKNLKSIDT